MSLALELSLVLAIAALVGLYAVEEFLGSRLELYYNWQILTFGLCQAHSTRYVRSALSNRGKASTQFFENGFAR